MRFISVSILIIYALSGHYEAKSIKEFSKGILSDISTIFVSGLVKIFGNCTVDPGVSEVSYWLYTRQTPEYVQISNLLIIDFTKPIVLLAHGWTGNKNVLTKIRDAYIKRYDLNVIAIDYGFYVGRDYFSAHCVLPKVAGNLAEFLYMLDRFYPIANLHIVGHSLGAQLAGQAGYFTQRKFGRIIGRITGLDPAGPLFQNIDPRLRLDKSDALFVDVIHTNQGLFGYIGNIGHVDFYPNCGTIQPACMSFAKGFISDILKMPIEFNLCNHRKSSDYFAESINNNSFYASACTRCGLLCKPSKNAYHTYMGESCRSPQKSQAYTLETASKPPFGLGPVAPYYK